MTDPDRWIAATRASHNRFAALTSSLSPEQVTAGSYASEWSNADVASHLGSQAEIFQPFFAAAVGQGEVPDSSSFAPIWDRWNALEPQQQIDQSIDANERFVNQVEGLTAAERSAFSLDMFGRQLDLDGALAMKLSEHAVHTWDVAVTLDPAATVAADAVGLLIDTLGPVAARTQTTDTGDPVTVTTHHPDRTFVLSFAPEVSLTPTDDTADHEDLELSAEALLRLLYGRLDPDHTPADAGPADVLDRLRAVFTGF